MPVTERSLGPPTVSVVVTNYNYGNYVVACLESIANQSVSPAECIVIDDCSTDNSVAEIQRFISTHAVGSKFELHSVSENRGQMNAFVEGFRKTTGDLVVFVDSDDLLFDDFIETHVAAHLNDRFPAAITTSNEAIINRLGNVQSASIEKIHRSGEAPLQLTPGLPIPVIHVDQWRSTWTFGERTRFQQEARPLLYVAGGGNEIREWLWSTTSGCMFRRGALEHILRDEVRDIRLCADHYLLHYAHILGGTIIIQTVHGAYRRHGDNGFASHPIVGRGTLTGVFPEDATRAGLMHRLERDLLARQDELVWLMGGPRAAQALAAYLPTTTALRAALRVQRELRIPFLAILGPKVIKRRWLAWCRFRQFL